MDFQYNDFVYSIDANKKTLAKFMCYRPDKDMAVVEYDGRLYQYDIRSIVKATYKEVMSYFNKEIALANEAIKESTDDAKDYMLKIAGKKAGLHKTRIQMDMLGDQILKTSTAIQLMGEDNLDIEMSKQLNEMEKDQDRLAETIRSFCDTIERFENSLKIANNNKRSWVTAKNDWKTKKSQYMEANKNAKDG